MSFLLLHSSLSNSRQWQALIALLPENKCYAPDLRGYGYQANEAQFASQMMNRAKPYELALEAEPLLPWLEAQEAGSVVLIGHSYGGALALYLARRFPCKIKALLVFEPVAFHVLKAHDSPQAQQLLQQVVCLSQQLSTLNAKEAAQLFVDYWQGDGYFEAMPEALQQKLAQQVGKVTLDFEALIFEKTTLSHYEQHIRCPTLLLRGELSQPSALYVSELLAKALCQAQTVTVKTGHMGPVTHAEVVNSVLMSFLAHHQLLT